MLNKNHAYNLRHKKEEETPIKKSGKCLNITNLEHERRKKLEQIQELTKDNFKFLSLTKLVKLGIDNLYNELLVDVPEEEAVDKLKELYKEALF